MRIYKLLADDVDDTITYVIDYGEDCQAYPMVRIDGDDVYIIMNVADFNFYIGDAEPLTPNTFDTYAEKVGMALVELTKMISRTKEPPSATKTAKLTKMASIANEVLGVRDIYVVDRWKQICEYDIKWKIMCNAPLGEILRRLCGDFKEVVFRTPYTKAVVTPKEKVKVQIGEKFTTITINNDCLVNIKDYEVVVNE